MDTTETNTTATIKNAADVQTGAVQAAPGAGTACECANAAGCTCEKESTNPPKLLAIIPIPDAKIDHLRAQLVTIEAALESLNTRLTDNVELRKQAETQLAKLADELLDDLGAESVQADIEATKKELGMIETQARGLKTRIKTLSETGGALREEIVEAEKTAELLATARELFTHYCGLTNIRRAQRLEEKLQPYRMDSFSATAGLLRDAGNKARTRITELAADIGFELSQTDIDSLATAAHESQGLEQLREILTSFGINIKVFPNSAAPIFTDENMLIKWIADRFLT